MVPKSTSTIIVIGVAMIDSQWFAAAMKAFLAVMFWLSCEVPCKTIRKPAEG